MSSSFQSLLQMETIGVKPSLPPISRTRPVSMTHFRTQPRTCGFKVYCQVAVKPDPKASPLLPGTDEGLWPSSPPTITGATVRVTAPVKVYHVPRVPEVDLTGMDGQVKQYVGVFKGKQVTANRPFKVEFVKEIEGRGAVKFSAHLREDEFELV